MLVRLSQQQMGWGVHSMGSVRPLWLLGETQKLSEGLVALLASCWLVTGECGACPGPAQGPVQLQLTRWKLHEPPCPYLMSWAAGWPV